MLRSLWNRLRPWVAVETAVLVGLLGVVLGAWAFLALAAEVREGDTLAFDQSLLRALRRADDPAMPIGPRWLGEVARDLTALGGVSVLSLLSLTVIGFLLLRRQPRAAVFLATSLVGGLLLSSLFKHLYARERPSVVPHLSTFESASFPSGHSMLSAVAYLTLGVMLARLTAQRSLRWYFLGVAVLLTGLVGASRVFLGVHYPTDVLAGWSAGLGVGGAVRAGRPLAATARRGGEAGGLRAARVRASSRASARASGARESRRAGRGDRFATARRPCAAVASRSRTGGTQPHS